VLVPPQRRAATLVDSVELYANRGNEDDAAVRQEMKRIGPLEGELIGYAYVGSVPATRSVADYTPRMSRLTARGSGRQGQIACAEPLNIALAEKFLDASKNLGAILDLVIELIRGFIST
jgi:hypothetical protein